MSVLLGVDTGGTYTDAVLIRGDAEILASAKSLTTRHDLAVGIGNSVGAVLADAGVQPGDISMAALSTTLATNALVEGQGGRVALVYVGFRASDLEKHGLNEALRGDPVLLLDGGHDHTGSEAAPLDESALMAWLETISGVSGFAVAALFATRNPAHEDRVAELIRARTGAPVSCSHHLSARLNGPKRALTAVLNARLIGMIDRLIGRAQEQLVTQGITAPMMVVRGDGALISAAMARDKPIETILSGPAASIVGAGWLTGRRDAMVSDIGGTTTDVALLRNGRPAIDPQGARVGPFRTMVEAVAMRTTGLGGDSEVALVSEGLVAELTLGPARAVPISLLAYEAPDVVLPTLEEQLRSSTPGELDARFVRRVEGVSDAGLPARDAVLLDRIVGVHSAGSILRSRLEFQSLRRLRERGIVQIGALTPSDASHALGTLDSWSADGARMALDLFARKRTGAGERVAPDAETLAGMIVEQLAHQTCLALLESGFAEEEVDFGLPPESLARHVLMRRGLGGHHGLIRLETGLNLPVVGLGASAENYYPAVGRRLGCEMVLPGNGGVANAIGAVVGQVAMRQNGSVTSPTEGRFRVHLGGAPEDFADEDTALSTLERDLAERAAADASAAGVEDIEIHTERDIRKSTVEGRDVFIEATVTVIASGRPGIAK